MDSMMMNSDLDLHLDPCQSKIEDLAYNLVNVNSPSWYINPSFKTLFQERSNYDSIAACSPLTLAPKLYGVLEDAGPPSLSFFRSLPQPPPEKAWGIYALVFEEHGHKTMLYIGSGTNVQKGVSERMRSYSPTPSQAPRFVAKAYKNGYDISHRGLLCWTPQPAPGLVPRVRARFLVLEAVFTMLFHAAFSAITDSYAQHLLLWARDTVSWDPLCSHLPFKEAIRGDLSLSPDKSRQSPFSELRGWLPKPFWAVKGIEQPSAKKISRAIVGRACYRGPIGPTRTETVFSKRRLKCGTRPKEPLDSTAMSARSPLRVQARSKIISSQQGTRTMLPTFRSLQ
jgi:hypothetical protein